MNWVSSGHCRTTAAKVAKATNIPAWMEGDLGGPTPAEVLWQLLAVVGGRDRLLGFFFLSRDVVFNMLTISECPTLMHTLGTLIRLSK